MADVRLFKIKEYATYTSQSVGGVYNKISRGENVPGLVRLSGSGSRGSLRFDKKKVDEWLDKQSKGSE